MIVCICQRVSDRDIARAARDGCQSFDDLQIRTGVATTCGKCHDCARQTFELHASAAAATVRDTTACLAHAHQAMITAATSALGPASLETPTTAGA
jgi:bacterioferritin-associated ferredoxin